MRLTLFAILGLVANCSVLAAPAPKEQPWVTGWQTVYKDKNSRFARVGNVLTIEVTGKKGVTLKSLPLSRTPCLLRDVSGDFVVEVRLSGNFLPVELPKKQDDNPEVVAGLVLMEGEKTFARMQRTTFRLVDESVTRVDIYLFSRGEAGRGYSYCAAWPVEQVFYFRLGRTGDKIFTSHSTDGKHWDEPTSDTWPLPKKLKLGVFAASESEGRFAPRFDRFKLTLKGTKGH